MAMESKVFISFAAPGLEAEMLRASTANDPAALRQMTNRIDAANRIVQSWVEQSDGESVSCEGSRLRFLVRASALIDLPKIKEQYGQTVSSAIVAGVGTKLNEADLALKIAKHRGGDSMVLWTPDLSDELKQIEEGNKPKEDLSALAKGAADGDGITESQTAEAPAAPSKPAPEHSQTESAHATMDSDPPPPEETASADNLESGFHQEASQAQQPQQAPQGDSSQLRTQVVQVLQSLKAQMPILEQVKTSAPDTYKAVMDLTQSVIMMARAMNGDPPNSPGARELSDRASSNAQVQVPPPAEEEGEEKSKDTKKSEAPLDKMAIRDIKPGPPIGTDHLSEPGLEALDEFDDGSAPTNRFDYSHLLHPALQDKYHLTVSHSTDASDSPFASSPDEESLSATLSDHTGRQMGKVEGIISPRGLSPNYAFLEPHLRGSGLGVRMYEALYAHALHNHGAKTVFGTSHSSSARKVHEALAAKHGMKYSPHKQGLAQKKYKGADFDGDNDGYSYALKSEKESDSDALTDCDQFPHIYGSFDGGDECCMLCGANREEEEEAMEKALPTSGAENRANRSGFFNDPVALDQHLENSGQAVTEPPNFNPKATWPYPPGAEGARLFQANQENVFDRLRNNGSNEGPDIAHLGHPFRDAQGWKKLGVQTSQIPSLHIPSIGEVRFSPTWPNGQGQDIHNEDHGLIGMYDAKEKHLDWSDRMKRLFEPHEAALRNHIDSHMQHVQPMPPEDQLHTIAPQGTPTAKASLNPNAGAPPQRHHLQLPVGSHIDPGPEMGHEAGKIKIQHSPESGSKTGWVSARAGQVLSPEGQPVSSKSPNAK